MDCIHLPIGILPNRIKALLALVVFLANVQSWVRYQLGVPGHNRALELARTTRLQALGLRADLRWAGVTQGLGYRASYAVQPIRHKPHGSGVQSVEHHPLATALHRFC